MVLIEMLTNAKTFKIILLAGSIKHSIVSGESFHLVKKGDVMILSVYS